MRVPQKRLFLAILVALSGRIASANCPDDGRLNHAYTQITTKLFHKGVLKVEDLQAIASSSGPVNPLRARTATSADSMAIQAYRMLIERGIAPEIWAGVRQEVTALIGETLGHTQMAVEAKQDTRIILNPSAPEFFTSRSVWQTSSGRIVFLGVLPSGNLELRDLVSRELLWHGAEPGDIKYAGISEAPNGDVLVNLLRKATDVPGMWERFLNMPYRYFERETINTHTGSSEKQTLPIPLAPPYSITSYIGSRGHADVIEQAGKSPFYFGERVRPAPMVEAISEIPVKAADGSIVILAGKNSGLSMRLGFYKLEGDEVVPAHSKAFALWRGSFMTEGIQLRDGRFTVAAARRYFGMEQGLNKIQYFAPARDGGGKPVTLKVSGTIIHRMQIYETEAGQILLAAYSMEGKSLLDIFEPSASVQAKFTIRLPSPMTSPIKFFEREGMLYAALVTGDSRILIYQLDGSESPVISFKVESPYEALEVMRTADQAYLIYGGSYRALFNPTNSH